MATKKPLGSRNDVLKVAKKGFLQLLEIQNGSYVGKIIQQQPNNFQIQFSLVLPKSLIFFLRFFRNPSPEVFSVPPRVSLQIHLAASNRTSIGLGVSISPVPETHQNATENRPFIGPKRQPKDRLPFQPSIFYGYNESC